MSQYQSRLAAILGPTNTGKTYYAIERMLARNSGVIGLPLRLLAREVYDKVVTLRGLNSVALITGEERIVPAKAKYWVCTVEAMPQDIGPEFVAIDEIQLCADQERGHVFTDRLLNMRGSMETLFLGADTMRKVIGQLIPNVEFVTRSRFSDLEYTGPKKTSRMPTRSAIVGFSVDNVYAVAELLRRQKGGAAVVMGALSPRTRNAQVELYQNGDVDYLVATDAIGMGLNLDINHVAFSSLTKFDGSRMRYLMPNELAQIAGRAGRHLNSGTFGVTGEAPHLDQEVVDAIENHKFAPLKKLQWRNSRLEFGTTNALINSLDKSSDDPLLIKAQPAEDFRTLSTLVEDGEVSARASDGPSVKLLWDTCGIPDFRGVSFTDHTTLVSRIFNFLHEKGEVSENWLAQKIANIDKTGGDIDTISKRLAFIRTWTYICQRKGWVQNESYWREETRAVEDRLSDALHSALSQRFIDRRTSMLMRRLKQKESLVAEVDTKGEVTIEGEFVGKLNGFRFQMDKDATAEEGKTLRAASIQALQPEFNLRADRMYNAPDTEFEFTEQGGLMWGEYGVGKLIKGDDILSPRIEVFVDDEAGNEVLIKVQKRLRHFIERKINSAFEPLLVMRDDEMVTGMARGLAFRLVESLGVIPRSVVAKDVKELDQDGRGLLRKHGVRFGQYTLFQQLMLKPAPTRLRLVLWSLFEGLDEFPEAPPPGLVTIPETKGSPKGYYPRAGYRLAGDRAIRIDMLERLADLTRSQNVKDGFEANSDMLSISGTTLEQFSNMMEGLGFSVEKNQREKIKPEVKEGEVTKDDEGDEDTIETFYVFKWVPKVRSVQKEHTQKINNQAKKNKKPKSTNFKKQSSLPIKKDKPLDPDNPFAALMALKGKS
ncbi:helicase-related protein [Amylibacter sp.]|jgi:ATP-dependent RNA helicase SUPV3L1/SUV3|nr:helicase-related protein [Amylibacter sp.]MDA8761643.1 helicase-related protein [Amylibacter sp.]MDA9074867.1 helicase-related protein [Amylibacter sp.]MDA9300649.1 helicase-related protein [Amylibacter sp.]MDB2337856.1 helicase-related protein [Amylibacter sp.]|tara:strand:+ start:4786 stop:7431 length:2646 start_codon:yes stop_codon:yes gene_type:complete